MPIPTFRSMRPESPVSPAIAAVRLAIGVLQGLALYWLYRARHLDAWPATDPYLFPLLVLLLTLVPLLLVSGLGHLRDRQMVLWCVSAGVLIALLAAHDVWRRGGLPAGTALLPSPELALALAFSLYVAHALMLANAQERSVIDFYPCCFDTAWKLLIQAAFSAFFTGMLWTVLWLGALLFKLVGIGVLEKLIGQSWFAILVTATAFSCGLHITDVRASLVEGIRSVLLALLSWLLPAAVLLIGGFLLLLPVTGLQSLWATGHATALLLCTAILLIVLVNAAFQDGSVAGRTPLVLRASGRIAALLLLPLTLIAAHALALRVGDYGWTVDRIHAAAGVFIALCYALGYAWAAVRRGDWLAPLGRFNLVAALIAAGVPLVLFSPLADPARIAVNSQMARLETGGVAAEDFDFNYLKREGKRYGHAALENLKKRTEGKDAALIRERAQLALTQHDPDAPPPIDVLTSVKVWPAGTPLPASFVRQDWKRSEQRWRLPPCLSAGDSQCDAYLHDWDGDGRPEILLVGVERFAGAVLLSEDETGGWHADHHLPAWLAGCAPLRDKLRAGDFRLVEPKRKALEIAGLLIEAVPDEPDRRKCPVQDGK